MMIAQMADPAIHPIEKTAYTKIAKVFKERFGDLGNVL
jgi:hypothetical protein